jgi:hypothetical protein
MVVVAVQGALSTKDTQMNWLASSRNRAAFKLRTSPSSEIAGLETVFSASVTNFKRPRSVYTLPNGVNCGASD